MNLAYENVSTDVTIFETFILPPIMIEILLHLLRQLLNPSKHFPLQKCNGYFVEYDKLWCKIAYVHYVVFSFATK